MNKKKEMILNRIKPYEDFWLHKDLVAFTVGESYFYYKDEDEEDVYGEFEELIVIVEKDWLFEYMMEDGVENPLYYLQNEYIWDNSIEWFNEASRLGKIAMVEFN